MPPASTAPAPARAPSREDAPATGAEALLRALAEGGVEVAFANPGTTEMWLVGALDKIPAIRPILGLHETVCAGAADGYARVARKPACTRPIRLAPKKKKTDATQILHLGPGFANAIANLHNARRANSPVINIVGDMATWHHGADALLEMDVDALSRTVSAHSHRSAVPGAARDDALDALRATKRRAYDRPSADGFGRVATLIVPHDRSWERPSGLLANLARDDDEDSDEDADDAVDDVRVAKTREFIAGCAAALVACAPGKAALYCGGDALIADDGALQAAGDVAAMVDAALLCENAFARIDRGGGLPHPTRLPYFPRDAARALAAFDVIVTADARRPIAMFGYDGAGPSHLIRQDDDRVWDIDAGARVAEALAMLRDEVSRLLLRRDDFRSEPAIRASPPPPPHVPPPPPLPTGPLTPASLCAVVAATQPEGTILVDESLTSGGSYWDVSAGCPRFTHLALTGGAIGFGPPASVGAAVAAPGRRVVNLQADGSGLYAPQALWTQARERLDVVTVVCANAKYAILKLELAMQRVGRPGDASRRLTDVADPAIRWVELAEGFGVPARSVDTAEAFAEAMREALTRSGPSLIEAKLA